MQVSLTLFRFPGVSHFSYLNCSARPPVKLRGFMRKGMPKTAKTVMSSPMRITHTRYLDDYLLTCEFQLSAGLNPDRWQGDSHRLLPLPAKSKSTSGFTYTKPFLSRWPALYSDKTLQTLFLQWRVSLVFAAIDFFGSDSYPSIIFLLYCVLIMLSWPRVFSCHHRIAV